MTKSSFSTVCLLVGLLWLGLLLRPTPVATQASLVAPEYCAFDLNGAPLVGGTLTSYVAGTTTPLALYTDFALTTPHPNPVTLNGRGCVVAYMQAATYRFVLRDSAGVLVYDVTIVSSPALHTVNLDVQATAGETVGAGQLVFLADGSDSTTAGRWHLADADLASKSSQARAVGITLGAITVGGTGSVRVQGRVTGLSGLTPGSPYYASATAGALAASPPANRRYVGMAETASTFVLATGILDATTPVLPSLTVTGASVLTGAVTGGTYNGQTISSAANFTGSMTVAGVTSLNGTVGVNHAGPHSVASNSATGVIWNVRNTNAGSFALSRVSLGNDATTDALLIEHHSTGYTGSGPSAPDSASLRATRSGGLNLAAIHASGAIRLFTGGNLTARGTLSASGVWTVPLQPTFLAYNSVGDTVATGATLEFDTATVNVGSHYNTTTDTFTAPVTGTYLLCAAVQFADNSSSAYTLELVTSNRTYELDNRAAVSAGTTPPTCVPADMDASDTASVRVTTGDLDIDILGGASPLVTYFSGRLL